MFKLILKMFDATKLIQIKINILNLTIKTCLNQKHNKK